LRASFALSLVAAVILAGCGTTQGDRAVSGAVIGAGAGALAGAFVGVPALGAAIGAGVGATAGAVTSPSQVDLGKPVWK
jgi:osmotically inducible lipoprotein OsmB